MKKILLILVIISISSCQQQVLDKWKYPDNPRDIDFRQPGLSSIQEIALYGWFKIDSAIFKDQHNNIFVLTQKENFYGNHDSGSRFFGFVMSQNRNQFEFSSFGVQPYFKYPQYSDADKDKWAFFHFSYSFSLKRANFYVKLATTVINETGTPSHSPSSFYRLMVSAGVPSIPKFSGELRNFNMNTAPGSYRESNYDGLMLQTNPDFEGKQCPIFYSECNYKGNAISLCEKKPISFDNIKSIKLPPNYSVKIPHPKDPTKKVVYNSDVECITSFNWTTFSEKDISQKKKSNHLKRNH